MSQEWHNLYQALDQADYSGITLENGFYNRLITVLNDPMAGIGDICCAYRDALMACPNEGVTHKDLPAQRLDANLDGLINFGIQIQSKKYVTLDTNSKLLTNEGPINLSRVYDGKVKSKIQKFPIDPSLANALNDDSYHSYNGQAQQMAVRVSLLAKPDSTTIINLPTGTGKTLVAHALCLFAPKNKLTLVIVPTTALALDQGNRASELLEQTGQYNGSCHYWHSGQEEQQHADIKDSIRDGRQRILFVSPEAACKSLLVVLFDLAKTGMLDSIILDEAHMVDEWGSEFRPYYQILSPILRSLRAVTSTSKRGIKCFLMSATFTDKSIDTVKGLFADSEESIVEIHGGFLRPEIQYSVHRVGLTEHTNTVLAAAKLLPKPLIIYVIKPSEAKFFAQQLRQMEIKRVEVFSGQTKSDERREFLKSWSSGDVDIMVATAAFGMGVDKGNVRSILHASIPPNMDTFYQQVGRGGRDGRACQSLLIYHEAQCDKARETNSTTLIGKRLGKMRWDEMWRLGDKAENVDRVLKLDAQHKDLTGASNGNVMWNWKTLLLMQRAGMISLIMDEPNPPSWDPTRSKPDNQQVRDHYFDEYYNQIKVEVLVGDIDGPDGWEGVFEQQRDVEYKLTNKGFESLWKWVSNSTDKPICSELETFYSVSEVIPDKTCGGCPGCRTVGRAHEFVPTCGRRCKVIGIESDQSWSGFLEGGLANLNVYYDPTTLRNPSNTKRIIRDWSWIELLIKSGTIKAIRATPETLNEIGAGWRGNNFWIGIPMDDKTDSVAGWPELVLLLPKDSAVPKLGFSSAPRLLIGPENLSHDDSLSRRWWENSENVTSLRMFLANAGIS
jgi:ATP-dependent DNA helicase RecQ